MIATLERPHARLRRPPVAVRQLHAAVSCNAVTKEFGAGDTKTLALRGVDLSLDDGKLTLLVGPSGCGKTTLISIIAGLLNSTQGNVSVFGTDLSKLSGRGLVKFRARTLALFFSNTTYCRRFQQLRMPPCR